MTIAQQTTIQAYQLNKGGSRARMAILRMIAADSVNNCNPHTRLNPGDWKAARNYTFKGYAGAFGMLSQGFNGEGYSRAPIWYCHTGEQFRGEQFADECSGSGIDRTGWFADVYGDSKVRGIVARLTHGRFIAGYHWDSNGERVYFGDVFTDECDAARMADEHARVYAEACIADSEKYEAARNLESENEDAMTRLLECLALRHRACMDYVRDEARELIQTIRGNRETLRTEYADYL